MARHVATTGHRDAIVAPATAAGVAAAIAIVRLSGAGVIALAAGMFTRPLDDAPAGLMQLGFVLDGEDRRIDQGLAVVWRAPASFTGEDVVEFHLHGSPAIVEATVAEACRRGARLATPGEFTRRAYENGKLDLAQAEAVSALTHARTAQAGRAALRHLQGGLSARLHALRADLIRVTAELEATVDFPEEGLPAADRERLAALLAGARTAIAELVASHARGQRLAEGATLVFAGAPNAGKSSLFNAILRRERAIVTPHPGTTRDTIEATVDLAGVPVTLVDTAGLRENAEEIEALGIARSRELIAAADLVLFVVDAGADPADALAQYHAVEGVPHLVVLNKLDGLAPDGVQPATDRARGLFAGAGTRGFRAISIRTRHGLDALEDDLAVWLGSAAPAGELILTSARHADQLAQAIASLDTALAGLTADLSPEFTITDLQDALAHIDQITGLTQIDEEILDLVFSTFCLGK